MQSSVKILCSVHKKKACTQHKNHSFLNKNSFFLVSGHENHPQNCGVRFLKVHQVN